MMTEEMRKDYEKACEAGRKYGKLLNEQTTPYRDDDWFYDDEDDDEDDGI